MFALKDLIELDIDFYRSKNQDLSDYTAAQAEDHYFRHGYREGRASSRYCTRNFFLRQFKKGLKSLEIGPFCSPALAGDNVDYVDLLDTEQLKRRAKKLGLSPKNVPKIDFVSRDGTLRCVSDGDYDLIFSSHVVEHQTDFVRHFNEVSDLLKDGGRYALVVPDARYCFDAFLPLSKLSDVMNAYHEARTVHTLGSVIEHRAMTTHNNPKAHWKTKLREVPAYQPINTQLVKKALEEFRKAEGANIDVHAWQFDPLSFSDIINNLIKLDLIGFSEISCNGPVYGKLEFTAVLTK